MYGLTARQASWGGPLWWPAVVSAAGIPALTAIGFAAGAWFPGRFVTPLITVVAFFGLGFGTQAAYGDHSYWQISPLTAGAFDIGAAPGVATFYPYLPDLSIAQVMFSAGLTVAILGVLGLPGRWLPFLRLDVTVALTGFAVGALTAAGTGAHLSGGFLDVLRNVAGLTGIGLLCAAVLGGPLAWTGPTAYMLVGMYALYTDWHPPTLTTPWIWPGRPPHDAGGALCAAVVFAAGLAAITLRGARDSAGD